MTRANRLTSGLVGISTLLLLVACVGGPDGGGRFSNRVPAPQAEGPAPDAPVPPAGGRIGTGSVKVALVVPLSGPGAAVGTAMRNAAELAIEDFQKPDLQILVKDAKRLDFLHRS